MVARSGGTYVVMHPAKLAEVLRGPNGPVVRDLIKAGELVKDEAQRRAPVSKAQPGERRSRRHGQLRNSIVKRVIERGGEAAVQVGTNDPVAMFVIKGTEPHLIRGRPLLVFYWGKVGKVVAFPRVNHPGTKPNDFLTKSLHVLRGRY